MTKEPKAVWLRVMEKWVKIWDKEDDKRREQDSRLEEHRKEKS